MMRYRLRYSPRFLHTLHALPGDVRSVANRWIKSLGDEPRPRQAKELEDNPGFFHLWLPRGHRLVWQVSEDDAVVDLL